MLKLTGTELVVSSAAAVGLELARFWVAKLLILICASVGIRLAAKLASSQGRLSLLNALAVLIAAVRTSTTIVSLIVIVS